MIAAQSRWSVVALAAALILSVPAAASAQSELNTSEATQFLGNWTVAFESPQGPANIGIRISDMNGKVGAMVSIAQLGEAPITNISRVGPGLALRYSLDFQGTPVNIAITLRPEGDGYVAALDFADGAFAMTTPATRAP